MTPNQRAARTEAALWDLCHQMQSAPDRYPADVRRAVASAWRGAFLWRDALQTRWGRPTAEHDEGGGDE